MLVAALVALLGTLVGIAATAVAVPRWLAERRAYLLAWSLAAVALTAALGAQTAGFAITFTPLLFRVVQVGGALLAGCWITWGIAEYLARRVPAAFGVRLVVVSYSIVAGVILAIDPLRRPPRGGAVPDAAQLYFALPLLLLGIAHAAVTLAVFGALVLGALRTRARDDRPVDRFACTLLAGLAAVAVVAATRPGLVPLPAPVYPLLLAAAVGLLWAGVARAKVPPARETAPLPRATRVPEAPPEPAPDRPPAAPPPPGSHDGPPAPSPAPVSPIPGREPYGLIAIFTLVDGAHGAFDRLTERTVREVRENEPGTLQYSCHTVANMPQQRIFYELYRDRQAYDEHQQQPHVRRFSSEHRPYVLATNVIELKLNAATDIADGPMRHGEAPRAR